MDSENGSMPIQRIRQSEGKLMALACENRLVGISSNDNHLALAYPAHPS